MSPQRRFGAPPAKLATATTTIEVLVAVAPDSAAAYSSADMTSYEFRLTLTLAFTTPCWYWSVTARLKLMVAKVPASIADVALIVISN